MAVQRMWNDFWKLFKTPEEASPSEEQQEAFAMHTFKTRVCAYRSSFNPYQRRAPGYDYVNWKPYGTVRDENPSHTYPQMCSALGAYVKQVVDSGMTGKEETMWVGVTGQSTGLSKPPSRAVSRDISRAGSREVLDVSLG